MIEEHHLELFFGRAWVFKYNISKAIIQSLFQWNIFSLYPSDMAVFPTPGSPISTGLFFVLLERICMHLRISSSLPITGSSLPFRAMVVKSFPYFSSDSYLPSGSVEKANHLHVLNVFNMKLFLKIEIN